MGTYEKIKKLCDQNGTTITALESALSFSRGSIGKIRSGSNPSLERMQKIAEFFGVEPSYFFDDTQNNAVRTQYNADLMELMNEAQKARTSDLRAVLEHLKRLNAYAEMLEQLEKGKEE